MRKRGTGVEREKKSKSRHESIECAHTNGNFNSNFAPNMALTYYTLHSKTFSQQFLSCRWFSCQHNHISGIEQQKKKCAQTSNGIDWHLFAEKIFSLARKQTHTDSTGVHDNLIEQTFYYHQHALNIIDVETISFIPNLERISIETVSSSFSFHFLPCLFCILLSCAHHIQCNQNKNANFRPKKKRNNQINSVLNVPYLIWAFLHVDGAHKKQFKCDALWTQKLRPKVW